MCGFLSTLLHPVLASSFPLWQDFSKRASFPIACAEWFYKKTVWGVVKSWEFEGKILWNEFCPFHEITGFTLALLYKVLRSENSEENSEESRLFTGANLVLRPASTRGVGNIKIERHPVRAVKLPKCRLFGLWYFLPQTIFVISGTHVVSYNWSFVVKLSPANWLYSILMFLRHILTERYRNWISWYLDVSPSWCRHIQSLGFLTGAPATKFALKRVITRYLTLFRATKNCVVICRASLLYEMGYPFRSTVFVPMEFGNIFRPKLNEAVTWFVRFSI